MNNNDEKNMVPKTDSLDAETKQNEILLEVPDALSDDNQQKAPLDENDDKKLPAEDGQDNVEASNDVVAPVITPGGGFQKFNFCEPLMQAIAEAGFSEPTPIQVKAIPELLAGRDLIGQALTGTGKTAAFGLPILEKIRDTAGLQLLVLVPTRELAAQVSAELYKLGRYAGVHTAAFTGGQSYSRQEQMLAKGVNALVATPGRLLDLIDSGLFQDRNPSFMVVDEADEMLDMGFLDDVKKIFAHFSGPRQTMLFSATMPRPVVALAQSILRDPVEITTAIQETTNNDIEQLFYIIEDSERTNAIIRLIDAERVGKAIIFCRTREETDQLNILLGGRGYNVNCLHGDMEQAQRSRVMGAFRRGEIDIMVATDVAARGLDVDDVTHVFNFHMPFDSRGYVHRIGRTGRAGKTGTAITLVTPREMRQLESIRRTVGAQLEHRFIPTRSEVTSKRLKRIFQELHEYELDIDLLNQVQTLSVNQDVLVLMAKLLKHQLSGGADQGPEHIGVAGQRLSRLLEPRSREDRRRDRDGGRHGRPMSRRGGGGEGQRHRHPEMAVMAEDADKGRARRPVRDEVSIERPASGAHMATAATATTTPFAKQFDRADFGPGNERGQRPANATYDAPSKGDKYSSAPRGDFVRQDRPPRRDGFGGGQDRQDRPPRRDGFGGGQDRPPRRDGFGGGQDRPPRRDGFGGGQDRPPRRDGFGGGQDRPPRRDGFGGGQDRPPRRDGFGGGQDRPPRRDGFGGGQDRPPRRDGFGGGQDRPPRRDGFGAGQDRPPRRDGFGAGFNRDYGADRPFQERGKHGQAAHSQASGSGKPYSGAKGGKGRDKKASSASGQSKKGTAAPASNKGWYLDAFMK